MASSSCKATMTIEHINGLNLIAGRLGIDGEIRLRIGGLNGRQDVWIILDLLCRIMRYYYSAIIIFQNVNREYIKPDNPKLSPFIYYE